MGRTRNCTNSEEQEARANGDRRMAMIPGRTCVECPYPVEQKVSVQRREGTNTGGQFPNVRICRLKKRPLNRFGNSTTNLVSPSVRPFGHDKKFSVEFPIRLSGPLLPSAQKSQDGDRSPVVSNGRKLRLTATEAESVCPLLVAGKERFSADMFG